MDRFDSLTLVDAGCGLSYVTMALAWCFENVFNHPAQMIGIDRNEALLARCREGAGLAELDDMLSFQACSIDAFRLDTPVHGVLSLHACDTATDDAIALGLAHRAELIAVAPCCQAELSSAWAKAADDQGDHPLVPLWRTPHLRREAAATVTDTFRMLLLRAAGYETRVVEFVASQHTAKNTLIRSMRRDDVDAEAVEEYLALRRATGGVGLPWESSVAAVAEQLP
jgi:hypothetical protein